jgi:hypothetical protein
MSYQRLAYDDASTTTQMASDCTEVDRALHLAAQRHHGLAPHPVADGSYDTVQVSDDLAALAAGLQLHFD